MKDMRPPPIKDFLSIDQLASPIWRRWFQDLTTSFNTVAPSSEDALVKEAFGSSVSEVLSPRLDEDEAKSLFDTVSKDYNKDITDIKVKAILDNLARDYSRIIDDIRLIQIMYPTVNATWESRIEALEASVFTPKVQNGVSVAAGSVTLTTPVKVDQSLIFFASKGSAGYVAARGDITGTLSPTGDGTMHIGGSSTHSYEENVNSPTYDGTRSLSGGTTDLTAKQYSAVLSDEVAGYYTKVTYDGPVEWQVFYWL